MRDNRHLLKILIKKLLKKALVCLVWDYKKKVHSLFTAHGWCLIHNEIMNDIYIHILKEKIILNLRSFFAMDKQSVLAIFPCPQTMYANLVFLDYARPHTDSALPKR